MIWRILATVRNRTIEKNMHCPGKVQKRVLKKILRQSQNCQIAYDFQFDKVKNIEDFRQAMPVTDYDFYRPYIKDILRGKGNVLFPGKHIGIAQSGGTTSDPKFFPLGKNLIKSYRQFNLDMAFCYMNDSGHYDILSDRIFLVVASPNDALPNNNIPVGRATGVMAQIAPALLRKRYVPNMDVILNTDIQEKIRQTTQQAFLHRKHVRMAAGLTPYLMAAFENLMHYAQDRSTEYDKVGDIFPNLKVAFHGGTTFDFYSKKIQKLAGASIAHRNVYSAAEGPIAFQFSGTSPGLLPALDGVFFEFMPVNQPINKNPDVLLLDEIKCYEPYYILLTTQGGLFRYKIGDQVEFIQKEPPLMRVLGRSEDQIDLSGEKLGVSEAAEALMQTSNSLEKTISDFIVSPSNPEIFNTIISHEWIIECETPPKNTAAFRDTLDKALFALNQRYRQLRNSDFPLGPPMIKFVSTGTFQRYMENELVYGQQKMIHMHNDRKCTERLLSYA